MSGFHRGRRELHASADLLAEVARDVAAYQRGDGLADGAVLERPLHIGELGVEALRIADGEEQILLLGQRYQLLGFPELQRDGLFRGTRACRRACFLWRWDSAWARGWSRSDRIDGLVLKQLAVVGGRGDRLGLVGDFLEAVFLDLGDVKLVDPRARGGGDGAYASAQPVPMMATLICFLFISPL